MGAQSANFRIFYDPKPATLTQGQLIHTSCYAEGEIIAKIAAPSPMLLETAGLTKKAGTRVYRPLPGQLQRPEATHPS